jgi:hypothetical protein
MITENSEKIPNRTKWFSVIAVVLAVAGAGLFEYADRSMPGHDTLWKVAIAALGGLAGYLFNLRSKPRKG